ncbi:MAG: hypothetical protein M1838_000710 [Thelocarpon superellum]|nr:MAG: hypothetical protein M1838_000710 [Thelocarpon superellum]
MAVRVCWSGLRATGSLRAAPLQLRLWWPGRSSSSTAVPRVAQSSVWKSIVPVFLRRSASPGKAVSSTTPKATGWNPATFFIVMFMLIGSQAIQMIALRSDFATFSRRTDVKIALLKEVIERIQAGEEVDVEGLLGTGDAAQEREWEAVIQDIIDEDTAWQSKVEERRAGLPAAEAPPNTSDDISSASDASVQGPEVPRDKDQAPPSRGVFY